MNKDLYGKNIQIPDTVKEYLQTCFDSAQGDETTEGYKRNKELRETGEITYQQLKRMKNWFDNYNGNDNDNPFILNGGHYVKSWVNDTLTSMRGDVKLGKEIKSTVLPNQFNSPHTKNNIADMNRPSQSHRNTIDYYNSQVTESLKRINDLIKKII